MEKKLLILPITQRHTVIFAKSCFLVFLSFCKEYFIFVEFLRIPEIFHVFQTRRNYLNDYRMAVWMYHSFLDWLHLWGT